MTADDSSSDAQGDAANMSQEGLTTGENLEQVMQLHGTKDTQGHESTTSLINKRISAPYHVR